jgi:hypothetical protein
MPVAPKLVLTFIAFAPALCSFGAEPIDFSRDVLPILSANCFPCHGRDASTREAKLRLDVREHALTARNDLTPIVPGKPDASEIMARITSKDEDERMPPADKGRALNTTEVETLRTWIAQGAVYSEHWAFLPLQRPIEPKVKDAAWTKSPVDRFVLARLEKENLKPAPRASGETLLRRASLDLIGLPPTPEEIEKFTSESASNPDAAFRSLVDRLLASPHYGERWGRHWLDVARYADSGGFETDIFFGHAWRYRDYVIRSFNADKPFTQFIKEQIAGDELFPENPEARIATGLYTTGPVLQEAGMVSGKLEYDQNTDFVDTTGAAFLGMTFACARCHDHKYDPVSHKEYFSLQAIFAASDQFDFAADGTKLRDRAALKNTQKEFEAEQARTRAQREKNPQHRAELLRKTGDAYIESDPQLKGRVDASRRYNIVARAVDRYQRVVSGAAPAKVSDTTDLLDEEDGDDTNAIALKAQLRGLVQSSGAAASVTLPDAKSDERRTADQRERALLHVGIVALLNPAPRGGGANRPPPAGTPTPVPPITAAPAAPSGASAAAAKQEAGANAGAQRQGRGGTMNPRRAFAALTNDAEKRAFLIDLGTRQLELPKPAGHIENIDQLRYETGEKHLNDASPIPNRFLAHRDKPIETRVLKRGELEMPGDVVSPGIPEALAAGFRFPGDDLPPNRRRTALAEWIASDKNLLTARVIANRIWQWHFGEGLVRTPNDFGIRGERPSHPELLNWLASELIEHGWSLKHLHRVIMNSSAYQQAATADATTLQRDPDNLLLARFQPHRLEAEIIWDKIRAASGTLDLTLFGLPIAPPLDEQEQLGNYRKWPASTPEESNRRAIYLLVKRSFRFPMLSAFDLPDNISSCGRRDITTVPNQGLTLLNNRTMQEQAAAFADRLLKETGGQLDALPARAWLHAYGRRISHDEQTQALQFLRERRNAKTAVAELCLAIFNTNEFIYQQ